MKLKIKILKCKDESFFYSKMIGHIVEVESSFSGYRYLCKNNTYGYISFEDAREMCKKLDHNNNCENMCLTRCVDGHEFHK